MLIKKIISTFVIFYSLHLAGMEKAKAISTVETIASRIYHETDYYIILGIPADSTKQQIERAYINLATLFIPSSFRTQDQPLAVTVFKKIFSSYQLIKHAPGFTQKNIGHFCKALETSNMQILAEMLEKGFLINVKMSNKEGEEFTPLTLAAQWSTPPVVKLLIQSGADVQQTFVKTFEGAAIRETALITALFNKNSANALAIVKILLDAGANGNDETFIVFLSQSNQIKIMRHIIGMPSVATEQALQFAHRFNSNASHTPTRYFYKLLKNKHFLNELLRKISGNEVDAQWLNNIAINTIMGLTSSNQLDLSEAGNVYFLQFFLSADYQFDFERLLAVAESTLTNIESAHVLTPMPYVKEDMETIVFLLKKALTEKATKMYCESM